MLKGLETAVYYVEDLPAASAWYKNVLGVTPHHDSPYYVGFTVGSHELGLHPMGDDPRTPGTHGQTVYWSVDDARRAVAHFIEHGARAHKPIDDVGGGILLGSVIDPFGNVLGVIQNPRSPNRG